MIKCDNEPCPLSFAVETKTIANRTYCRMVARIYFIYMCKIEITIKFSHKLYFSVYFKCHPFAHPFFIYWRLTSMKRMWKRVRRKKNELPFTLPIPMANSMGMNIKSNKGIVFHWELYESMSRASIQSRKVTHFLLSKWCTLHTHTNLWHTICTVV